MPATNERRSHKYVLAIDLGSGGPKVGLVEDTGRVVASAFERNEVLFLPNGGVEQDPRQWWRTVVSTARKVIQAARVPAESIVAVGCTSQWSVTVAVDADGEPLMNAVSWMDKRGAPYNQRITQGFPSVEGYALGKLIKTIRLAGIVPTHSGVDALGHMLFIKNERPDVYRRTHKFLEPMDFINLKLTGRFTACQSTVFPMILTDNRKPDCSTYDPWLLRVSGIEVAKLPELLPNDGIIGPLSPSVAADLGLRPDTVVIVGAGDNHTSAIGSGAVQNYEGVAVLGTSGMLCCHVPFKKTDVTNFLTTMPSPMRGRFLIFGDLGANGKVLDSYLTNFVSRTEQPGPIVLTADDYERMDQVAEQMPAGAGGLIFLPWFNGTYCPQEDAAMRGGFLNLSHQTTQAQMTRAVLEGIAFNWRWLLGPAQKFVGRTFDHLRLSGGGAQSDTWAQIFADVLGLPIHQQADPRNGNVLGIAFLAFNRLGMLDLSDISKLVKLRKVFVPREANRPIYDRLFGQFLECQKRLKPVFHALNRQAAA